VEKLMIFVSSVQKELENERIAITELVSSDPFLGRHVAAILFEELPASANSAEAAYLMALRSCNIYIGILGFEYGRKGPDGLSATHREYTEAKRLRMPTIFFVKGDNTQDSRRDDDMKAFFAEIRDEQHGHVYKRFTHYQSLKSSVRAVLLAKLEKLGMHPTSEETAIAEQTIAQASDFDSRLMERADITELDKDLCRRFAAACTGTPEKDLEENSIRKTLMNRGLTWQNEDSRAIHPTAAGLLLLGKNPETFFPQVRIAANAFGGKERGEPIDREDIRDALPIAIERTFQFLKRNMRHTTRIEGFSKVEIHEYPYEALREAVVNAVAHRDYDLAGSSIRVEKYADRIEIVSPGLPPEPITLQKIERLDYIACSRNPNLARGLSFFERIEEQGDGLRRIVREVERIGLPRPLFQFRDGHFKITFFAPEDMLKLKSHGARPVFEVPRHLLVNLSETQRTIIKQLIKRQTVKVPELAIELSVSPQAIRKAITPLVEAGLVIQEGKARGTTYSLKESLLG
jgi:predicted HTH transcriptional regulator